MIRRLAIAAALVAVASRARASDTYCVGGYEGVPPAVVAACGRPEVFAAHFAWHEHVFVTDGKKCYLCYDEEDNTCHSVFLATRPDYREADPFDCARENAAGPPAEIVAYVSNGREVVPPPPPPDVFTPAIVHVSGGPHGAGDRIRVVGVLKNGAGLGRAVTGGTFRIADGDGAIEEVPGTVGQDGLVTAEVSLPQAGPVEVSFVPGAPALAAGERLGAASSAPLRIELANCVYRARVSSPASGEPLAGGESVAIRVELRDAAGGPPVAPPSGLRLSVSAGVGGEPPAVLPVDPALFASWVPPAAAGITPVLLSAGGEASSGAVCSDGEVAAVLSETGLGLDVSGLPATCYQGLPCEGVARIRRAAAGSGKARADGILGPGAEVVIREGPNELYRGPPLAGDAYPIHVTYGRTGMAAWSVRIEGPTSLDLPTHAVALRRPLRLALPAGLDFGTVPAGTGPLDTCRRLDFSASQAAEEHRWELSVSGADGCVARPVLAFRNAAGAAELRPIGAKLVVDALDPKARWLDVCLEVPRCDGEAPRTAALRVLPLTPAFADQARSVALTWTVEGRGPFACHGFWLLPSSLILALVVGAAGLLRPARFDPAASIRVAGSEKGLRTAAPMVLTECPRSSAGFFRDAELGVLADGTVRGRARNAVARLRARREGGLALVAPGLEILDRRRMRWESVPDGASGHVPSPASVYRAGGVYFKLEVG